MLEIKNEQGKKKKRYTTSETHIATIICMRFLMITFFRWAHLLFDFISFQQRS